MEEQRIRKMRDVLVTDIPIPVEASDKGVVRYYAMLNTCDEDTVRLVTIHREGALSGKRWTSSMSYRWNNIEGTGCGYWENAVYVMPRERPENLAFDALRTYSKSLKS